MMALNLAVASQRSAVLPRMAPAQRAVAAAAQKAIPATGRPQWIPGNIPPPHLDGSMVGDYGFDPLNLGKRPNVLYWFRQAELQHARWAMLGAAGIMITSAFGLPVWYEAGEVSLDNLPVPFGTLVAAQIFLMNFVEVKRFSDIQNPGSQAKPGSFGGKEDIFGPPAESRADVGYPGGWFNPFNVDKDLDMMKSKELANGRLAMMACLGFFAQWQATGKGPLQNLQDHVAAPLKTNFATNGVSLPDF